MKLRIGCLMFVLFSFVLPVVAQERNNPINSAQPDKTIILNDTTVTLTGPSGGAAPTVLQVTGGNSTGTTDNGSGILLTGGNGAPTSIDGFPPGVGGPIQLTGGNGGVGSTRRSFEPGGLGGPIVLTAGNGGDDGGNGLPGIGGSITLQPGTGGSGDRGLSGDIILAPSGGFVGIGTSAPANLLEVAAGGTTLADSWTVRSSRRFKTNVQPLEGALEKVEQLQGVSYKRKVDGKNEIGVVAEDVDQIVPELVSRDPRTNEVQGVDYSRLAVLLIEAVKSEQAEIRQLRAQVEQLRSSATGR
jgi:hypothetical protein